jgi:hypothetical protein
MRTLLLITLSFILFISKGNAQFINNLSIYPPNPTTNDSIYLIASCYFQSGTCDDKTLNYSIINETIDCNALHCIGMLTYICYNEDTFSIGKLPAGNYLYRYSVNAGFGPNPCTPGIVPGPFDSLGFTVNLASGLTDNLNQELIVYPNPCTDFIELKNLIQGTQTLSIIDMTGKICYTKELIGNNSLVSTNDLSPGLYLLRIQSNSGTNHSKLFHKM